MVHLIQKTKTVCKREKYCCTQLPILRVRIHGVYVTVYYIHCKLPGKYLKICVAEFMVFRRVVNFIQQLLSERVLTNVGLFKLINSDVNQSPSTLNGPAIRVMMNILKVDIHRHTHELLTNIYLKTEIRFGHEKSYVVKINLITDNSFFHSQTYPTYPLQV